MNRNLLKAAIALMIPCAILLHPVAGLAEQSMGRFGEGSGMRGPGGEGGPQMMLRQLGLSAEQNQKVRAIMEEGRSQSQALHQQLKSKRQAFMQYMHSSSASESRALSLMEEMNALQRQLSELRVRTWFKVRTNLTPEQLQRLSQMKPPANRMGGQMNDQRGMRRGGQDSNGIRRPGMMSPNSGRNHAEFNSFP